MKIKNIGKFQYKHLLKLKSKEFIMELFNSKIKTVFILKAVLNTTTKSLDVWFVGSGGIKKYRYYGVSKKTYLDWGNTKDKIAFFTKKIRNGGYEFKKTQTITI